MLYQNLIATAVAFALILLVPVYAHPGEVGPILTSRQLERRQAATHARHAVARNCDGAIAAFEAQRRAKRSALMAKKHTNHLVASASATTSANTPTYTTLQNVGIVFDFSIPPYSFVVR